MDTGEKKTIFWTCTAKAGWNWRNAAGASVPVADDTVRSGTIVLSDNNQFWHLCVGLVIEGRTTGDAMLRYFKDGANYVVQVQTVAQGVWMDTGKPGQQSTTGERGASGGISLEARISG